MNNSSTDISRDSACEARHTRRLARSRQAWFTHAATYVAVVGGLSLMATLHDRHLPVAMAVGWGMGLAIHGLRVLLSGGQRPAA